ncbi:MAG: citrate synthase [Bdellovibrionales bacterium]|nr:citrate synthase [Bdellovibrionales bacterium]
MSDVKIPETANKGLEGVVAFTSEISAIVDVTLSYCGYTIEDLAKNSNFEEVAFLLWNLRLPKEGEWKDWQKEIRANYELPAELVETMKRFPKTASPMEVLRTSVSMLSLWDSDSSNDSPEALRRKSVRLLAKLPALATTWHRVRNGWDPVKPDPNKTIAANFFYTLNGKDADPEVVKMFDTALVLHADHEMNASTFSARVTTATLSDVHSAITTAIGTLKGPLHGGANEEAMYMLQEIATPENAEAWIRDALANKKKIMGFGHREYKKGDSRAIYLTQVAKEIGRRMNNTKWGDIADILERIMLEEKNLYPNVDFPAAYAYFLLGIPIDLYTPIFVIARTTGWTAHAIEQLDNNRLIRPKCIYEGPHNVPFIPIEER